MEDFILKDNLCHKAYSWPKTVLTFPKKGKYPEIENNQLSMNSKPIPYEAIKTGENSYELKLVADLPYCGKHKFSFKRIKNPFANTNLGQDNGLIKVENIEGSLCAIKLKTGESFFYNIDTDLKLKFETVDIKGGAIETVFTKKLEFEGNRNYKFELRLKKDMDFIEIYEKMSGFSEGEANLKINWECFNPTHRFTKDRLEEQIDDYINDDGSFPFTVNPFMARCSWTEQRFVAYLNKKGKLWSGLLLHDLEHYDDKQYAIWGSRNNLAFKPFTDSWQAPIIDGKRAFMHILCRDMPCTAIEKHYLRYYSVASLNNVKDFVLDWKDNKNNYPKYFKVSANTRWGGFYAQHIGAPSVEDMLNILDRDSTVFANIENIAPVSYRAFRTSWAQTFDLSANRMTDEEFKRVRSAMAFVCYVFSKESFYPIQNMLAGHPNFLADVAGTVAVFASLLGEAHPMYKEWLSYYEIAMARNFKYHLRPDVKEWSALGGRWTENTGGYLKHFTQCVVHDCHIIYALNNGEMPILYPHIKRFVEYLINMQNTENIHKRRLYPPQGAHANSKEIDGNFEPTFYLSIMMLADMLKRYEPLYAEYLLHNFRNQSDFDALLNEDGIYGETYRRFSKNCFGTPPNLYSAKYTGLGIMMRSNVNTDQEMNVFLQQLDEGTNYRWGRAAQGGCGEIYYYANRKKYTDHAPEDVGDENRGDVQSSTNFGVLVGSQYKSVGRNELTEPFMDFDFVKYARINAGEYSKPYYKYRSVMMIENRYIAIYDAVGDLKQHGRFTWAQNQTDDFPNIWNLKPNVNGFLENSGIPLDKHSNYKSRFSPSRIMSYDGQGDFFTIVSHLRAYNDERLINGVCKKNYGAEIEFPQTKDRVFNEQSLINIKEADFSFVGYAGYMAELSQEIRLAIFNGSQIALGNTAITIPFDKNKRRGISLKKRNSRISGKAVFEEQGEVYIKTPLIKNADIFIDGKKVHYEYNNNVYCFIMPKGSHSYNIAKTADIGEVIIDRIVENMNGITVKWNETVGATSYLVELSDDFGETYKLAGKTNAVIGENSFSIKGLQKKKYFVRIYAKNKEQIGNPSHPYPIYITNELPKPPVGLRIVASNDSYEASWGKVLGADRYLVFKKEGAQNKLVYDGSEQSTSVQEGEYYVVSVSGIGVSVPSLSRSTFDIRARWDNHPEKGYIRDTRSHEHGYAGFDFVNNPQKPILKYPK